MTVLLMLTFARDDGTHWAAPLIAGGDLPPLAPSVHPHQNEAGLL
jgi:hypothetical protein